MYGPLLKCNENAALLFKNNRNKEKVPFYLKSGIFCYVWWLLLFPR